MFTVADRSYFAGELAEKVRHAVKRTVAIEQQGEGTNFFA
jgi:hypothetical protein